MSIHTISEEFVQSYLNEYDFKFANANLPVDPAFIHDVETVIELVLGSAGAGFFGKLGSDMYDKIKQQLLKHLSAKYPRNNPRVILIEGEDRDKTILNFGRVRPAFKIGKGNILVLRNLTILYDGDPHNLIEEEMAASFVPVNVAFKQVSTYSIPRK